MPQIPSTNIINAAGDWDITLPKACDEYVFTLTGTWNGATAVISRWKEGLQAYKPITGGTLTADFEERGFVPDSQKIRITITGTPTLELTLSPRI